MFLPALNFTSSSMNPFLIVSSNFNPRSIVSYYYQCMRRSFTRTIKLCTVYQSCIGWRQRSSANKNSVLRKEYRREHQYLSIEIQPYIYTYVLTRVEFHFVFDEPVFDRFFEL